MSLAGRIRVANHRLGDQQTAMAMASFSAGPLRVDAWRRPSGIALIGIPQPAAAVCPYCDEDGYTMSFVDLPSGVLRTAECAMCGVRTERFVAGWRAPRS